MMQKVGLKALRAHAVRRSLFTPTALAGAIDTLGFVQLDPIRAPARAADLVLRHRVAGYRVGDLDRAYPDMPLAEDYVHVYGVLPTATQALLHPRPKGTWRVESEHPRMAARIVAHIRAHGVTHPRDLHRVLGKASSGNGWGGNSAATTRMLEALQYRGKLRVARREGGIRLYDLAPPLPRPRASIARAREIFTLLLRLYAPLPEASFRHLAWMVTDASVPPDVRAKVLAQMRDGKGVRRVDGEGTVFVLPEGEALVTEPDDRVRLLAPFDPIVWDRRRFELFWGWDYRFEAYTPQPKRRFGYYALPLLWRDDVIGWANAALDKEMLVVAVGFARKRPRGAAFVRALECEVEALATTLGATRFAIGAA